MEIPKKNVGAYRELDRSATYNFLRKFLIAVLAIVLFIILILVNLNLEPEYNLLHIPLEFFSILIAWTIFVIAWNSREFSDNNFFYL